LYSETLDRRHVCGNGLRLSAAGPIAKGFAGDLRAFLGVPTRDR